MERINPMLTYCTWQPEKSCDNCAYGSQNYGDEPWCNSYQEGGDPCRFWEPMRTWAGDLPICRHHLGFVAGSCEFCPLAAEYEPEN